MEKIKNNLNKIVAVFAIFSLGFIAISLLGYIGNSLSVGFWVGIIEDLIIACADIILLYAAVKGMLKPKHAFIALFVFLGAYVARPLFNTIYYSIDYEKFYTGYLSSFIIYTTILVLLVVGLKMKKYKIAMVTFVFLALYVALSVLGNGSSFSCANLLRLASVAGILYFNTGACEEAKTEDEKPEEEASSSKE